MYESYMYACTYWCKYRHMLMSEHPQVAALTLYLICNNVSLFVSLLEALHSRLGGPSRLGSVSLLTSGDGVDSFRFSWPALYKFWDLNSGVCMSMTRS